MEKQAENPWELKDFLQHPAKMSLEEISEAIFLRMSAKAKALDRRVGCLRGGARTLKIVVPDIERQLLPEIIETADLRFVEKLLPQRPPEPFHFSIGLRMVGAADRMLDLVVAQIGSELVVPCPADELTAAVGQDFFRERVVTARFFQQINGISNRLAMKQIQGYNITRIIIQIADDKDFFVVRHDEIHHVGMPQFIGRAPFEEPHRCGGTHGSGRCRR